MVFFTLEHREGEDRSMKKKRKLLLLLAILAATITYQTGLTPPGAFWQEGQSAGYAVLATNYPPHYTVFFYCNAASFMSSIAVIILLFNPNLYKFGIKCYVLYVCAVAGLFGLAGAYATGSSRHMRTSVVVFVILGIVCVFVVLLLGALSIIKNKSTGEEDLTTKKEGGQSTDEKKKAMYTTRKYMTMVAILVAGVTYQAGLTPPGGVWPESTDGHAAGDPVLHDTNKRRYRLFFDSNSVSFLTSLLVILLILLDEPLFGRKKKDGGAAGVFGMGFDELLRVAQTSLLLALLSLLFAYAAGCSWEFETSGYVFALAAGVLLYIVIHVSHTMISVRYIFVHVYFPHLLGGFLHILTCTCNYMLWPLAPREYNLSIPNMVSEQ
jgi:hypothetical protein